jgi:hypothetical protein
MILSHRSVIRRAALTVRFHVTFERGSAVSSFAIPDESDLASRSTDQTVARTTFSITGRR